MRPGLSERFAAAERVVRRNAARFARRCWWAEKEELEQVGWLAVADASRTFDARVGVEWEAYVDRAAQFAIKRFLWSMSAPVTGGSHRPKESYAGLYRTRVADERAEDDELPRGAVLRDSAPLPDALLAEKRWTQRVLVRAAQVMEPSTATLRSCIVGDAEMWTLYLEKTNGEHDA